MATPLERTIQQIQDAMVVMGELQARQARVQKTQAEELEGLRTMTRQRLAAHEQAMQEHELRLAEHDRRMKDLDERIAKLVSGIGEFLRKN